MEPVAKQMVIATLDKAIALQAPVARRDVARLRRVNPTDTPGRLAQRVTRRYLSLVATSGATKGAVGAGPKSTMVEFVAFTDITVLYVLSLAEIYDVHPDDFERRRDLVQTVVIGDALVAGASKTTTEVVPHWSKQIVNRIPMSAIHRANGFLRPYFITKYGETRGVVVLSKHIPLILFAGLGAGTNYAIGRGIVARAKKILGPTPESFLTDLTTDPTAPHERIVIEADWVQETDDKDEPA